MWFNNSVFYQIYPLGFCDCPLENDGVCVNRIQKVADWIPHISELGANAIYFSPVFESDKHGYDTRDYTKIDSRLGTNEDFAKVCNSLHEAGIKVVLDGVFNHVGRGFWAFQDVIANRESSRYRDWFNIDFNGNTCYNDGFHYESWEGHYELVKLNLYNNEVIEHIFTAIKQWVEEFGIDGLRLDVAYCLNHDFLRRLRQFANTIKEDFVLIGELLHGDYNMFVNDEMCHSCTNYECYKGLFSSFNCMNMFEIMHSLNRQFGAENWTLYRGKHLLSFVDNHDVSRIASNLQNKEHLPLIYGLLFGMPGVPCVYYGSEWGALGNKSDGDHTLRMSYELPIENDLSKLISQLAEIRKSSKAVVYGDLRSITLTNKQTVFSRECDGEKVIFAINADCQEYTAYGDYGFEGEDLLTGENILLNQGINLKAYDLKVIKVK